VNPERLPAKQSFATARSWPTRVGSERQLKAPAKRQVSACELLD